MTRDKIYEIISSKEQTIKDLKSDILELRKQGLLLSDDTQQYYEKEVEVVISKRPKVVEKQLLGFIKWKEEFLNQEGGEVLSIERNKIVHINGEWQI